MQGLYLLILLAFLGQLGSLPADARQDMLLEGLERDVVELREMQDRVHELTIRIGTLEALYDTSQSDNTN